MKILPLIFAVITILTPVITQKTGLSKKYGFQLKMLCAVLYLATGVISAASFGAVTDYSAMMLGALVLGMLGDFFLEYKEKKLFPLGVVFFALGHIVYSITFLFAGENNAASHIAVVLGITLAVTAAIVIPAKTKLKLNGKKNMLLIYVPVLVFSFACAVVRGVAAFGESNRIFGLCLISGGLLFFVSDIMIGVGKGGIKRPEFLHYAVSYTYFAAQALFALSILFQ
ncbi:MAG: lysoplasmalogenase [Clostridia bacterium]|nr:lysoplasmalogenase [Clostridia bacterium]